MIAGYMWKNIGPSAPFYYGSAVALLLALLLATLVKLNPQGQSAAQ